MKNKELDFAQVKHTMLENFVGTLSEVEKFMKKHTKEIEDGYKYKLTQSQNVVNWVNNPQTIDPTIKGNLEDLKTEIKKFSEKYPETKTLSFLDVGCYCGYMLDWLEANMPNGLSFKYVGIDIRKDAIVSATALHTRGEFKAQSVLDIKENFDAKEFDIVFCARTLIHLPLFQESLENLLYCTKNLLFVVGLVGKTSCELREKQNIATGENMKYFYRRVSKQDIQTIIDNGTTLELKVQNPYMSTIFWK